MSVIINLKDFKYLKIIITADVGLMKLITDIFY